MENSQIKKFNSVAEKIRNEHGYMIENLIFEFIYPRCANCKKFIRSTEDFYLANHCFDENDENDENFGGFTIDNVHQFFENIKKIWSKSTIFEHARKKYKNPDYFTYFIRRNNQNNIYFYNRLISLIKIKFNENLACSRKCCSSIIKSKGPLYYENGHLDLKKIKNESFYWKMKMDYDDYDTADFKNIFNKNKNLLKRIFVNWEIYNKIHQIDQTSVRGIAKKNIDDIQQYLGEVEPQYLIDYTKDFNKYAQKILPSYYIHGGQKIMNLIENNINHIFYLIDCMEIEEIGHDELREVLKIIKKLDTRNGRIPIEEKPIVNDEEEKQNFM